MYTAIKVTVAAAAIAASIGVAKADDCALLAQYGINCQDIEQTIVSSGGTASNVATVTQSGD